VTEASAGTVIVVDDDPAMREALRNLLRSVGLLVETYASGAEFFCAQLSGGPCCLVVDVRLPGKSGLEIHDELVRSNVALPVIFITGHGDIPMSVRAMKAGAVEFLTKPFRDQDLLEAIQTALVRDSTARENDQAVARLRLSFETLTPREREVMALVVAGYRNKQIAADLEVREITVKVHRGQVMRKMGARSVAALVRMADCLGGGLEKVVSPLNQRIINPIR
jgi:FixJ family two-component response regulator